MKTTNRSSLYLFGLGLLLSITLLSLPSCGLEVFDIVPDPSEYDSLSVTTTNGKFDKFTLDSVYLADIVVGVTDNNDTIRFVKGADNLTYYFIAPTNLPVGNHEVRVNALRTLLNLRIDTLTTLGSRTADGIISDYLRDEVTPNVNYFVPATPTLAGQLALLRDTTRALFNTLSTDQKKSVAITVLANKNFLQNFNTALRNLRSVPVNTVGPSAVCTGSDNKSYYPCLFENLGTTYTALEAQGRLLVVFARALNGSFFYVNSAGEYRLQLLSNPALVSGLLQFVNVLPKAMIVGDIGNKANNRTWIAEADFSQITNPGVFTHNIIASIPVKLSLRNIRSTDNGSALVGNYVTRFNAFRDWWNNSPLSFFPVTPALTPQTTELPLDNLSVIANLSLSNANVNKAVIVLGDGFRARFRIDSETVQNTNITLDISHQGFTFQHLFPASVKPQL